MGKKPHIISFFYLILTSRGFQLKFFPHDSKVVQKNQTMPVCVKYVKEEVVYIIMVASP